MTDTHLERDDPDLERLRFERMGRSLVRRFGTRAEIREMNQRLYENLFARSDSTPKERRVARGMWESGYTTRQIAGRLGRSNGTIWHWAQRWKAAALAERKRRAA